MTEGFREFEFDLPEALLTSLIKEFDGMESAPLLLDNVHTLPEAQGVYQLLLAGQVVYIGKTDAEAGLRKRLERHAYAVQHRQNLKPEDVSYKAVRVFVFTAIDLETQLIKHYNGRAPVVWNKSGFGSNDPGRNRETTDLKPDGFDARYPLDLEHLVQLSIPPGASATTILAALRQALPYTFRMEGGRKTHDDLHAAGPVSLHRHPTRHDP